MVTSFGRANRILEKDQWAQIKIIKKSSKFVLSWNCGPNLCL